MPATATTTPQLTKRKLLRVFTNERAIALALGYKEQSFVSRWGMDEPIPEVARLRLQYELRPEMNWDAIAAGK